MNMDKDFDLEIAEKFFERGKNRIIFEKYSEAIEDFTKAIELYPNDEIYSEILFMAYYARGFAYKKLKKYIEAMQDFETAMTYQCDPDASWHNHYICEQILFGYEDFVRWDYEAQKAFEFVCDDDKTAIHDE